MVNKRIEKFIQEEIFPSFDKVESVGMSFDASGVNIAISGSIGHPKARAGCNRSTSNRLEHYLELYSGEDDKVAYVSATTRILQHLPLLADDEEISVQYLISHLNLSKAEVLKGLKEALVRGCVKVVKTAYVKV